MSLRSRLAKLSKVAAARTPAEQLVIVCARVGTEMASGRAPGVYSRESGTWASDVVFDGNEPSDALVAAARARLGKSALVIVLGMKEVPPPTDFPDGRPA